MNEKEAREFIRKHETGNCDCDYENRCPFQEGEVYLECLEKAKGLEKVLDDVRYSLENIWAIDWKKYRDKFLVESREALAKWNKNK
jgi:hypothetical protein